MAKSSRRCGCTHRTRCAQHVTPVHTTPAEQRATVASRTTPYNEPGAHYEFATTTGLQRVRRRAD
jgi:hypothetical protein